MKSDEQLRIPPKANPPTVPVDKIEKIEQMLDEAPSSPLVLEKPLEKQLTEFLGHVSHEIRTPLTLLKESISILMDGTVGKPTPKQREYLVIGEQALERLNALVENLLDAARLTSGKIALHREIMKVTPLLSNCVQEAKPLAQKRKLRLTLSVEPHIQKIFVDGRKIEQVIHNLLNNALRFARRQIQISARVRDPQRFIEIDVLDDGPGIPTKELKSIFRRFHRFGQTEPSQHKGLGLGLSIAKELVELHNGTIWAESIVGVGSRFAFTLPIFPPTLEIVHHWIHKNAPSSGKDYHALQRTGWSEAFLLSLESLAVDQKWKNQVLDSLAKNQILKGECPNSLEHIEDFLHSPLADEENRPLRAVHFTEAFLMAYIEKNMGQYSYQGIPIYQAGPTAEEKRIALMKLVKSWSPKKIEQELHQLVRKNRP